MTRTLGLLGLAAALVGLSTGLSGQARPTASPPPPPGAGDWPQYANDVRGTKYSPLDQINASNFSKLEVAWRFKTDNFGPFPEFKLEGTPLMVGGVVYATGGTRRSVIALNAADGELLWMHSEVEGHRRAATEP